MNVAAYCRVSTDRDDQINSLENQTSFFNEYIRKNDQWNFVGVYADEGVTGTSVVRRVQFNKMIEDAKQGRIDLILTKEVSRFARNTVDALNFTRELRRIGVGVFFISDNINTLENDGELRLSLMSMLAQEESRKTSNRVKWGMRQQMEQGFVFSPPLLGYECSNGVLTVNREEAEIVRRIYDLYVNHNMGTKLIARNLASENTPLTKRLKSWSPTAIMRILTNEKYVGDLVQQKTKVVDYLSHKAVENKDDKLIFRDHHEPIIDRATWDEAQRIRASRSMDKVEHNPAKHSNKYWCSGRIQCGICHGSCVTKTKNARYGTIRIYRCKHTDYFVNEAGACTNKTYIDERILCACMRFVIQKLSPDAGEITRQLLEALRNSKERDACGSDIAALENQVTEITGKKKKMLALLADDVITKEDYQSAVRDFDAETLALNNRIHSLRQTANRLDVSPEYMASVLAHVAEYMAQDGVTRELYSEILEKIVVYDDAHVDVYLQGMESPFSVSYTSEGRGMQYKVLCEDYSRDMVGE